MVMARQQPPPPRQHRNNGGYKRPANGGSGDQADHQQRQEQQYSSNDYSAGNYYSSSVQQPHQPHFSTAARARTSPPTVPAAAAAASSNTGLSLYEELLQYHREHPDGGGDVSDEDASDDNNDTRKGSTKRNDLDTSTGHSSTVEDRKPAARPRPPATVTATRNNNATFRVPLDRAYFEQKQDLSPPGKPSLGLTSALHSPLYQQQSSPTLTEHWQDSDPRKQHRSPDSNRAFYSEGDMVAGSSRSPPQRHSVMLSSLIAPFPDAFQDVAEDEALARQLQAEEEERVAQEKATEAAASPRHSYVLPPQPASMPYFEGPQPNILDRDEALARQLAALSMAESSNKEKDHHPQEIVLPATLVVPPNQSSPPLSPVREPTQHGAYDVSPPRNNNPPSPPPSSSSFIPTITAYHHHPSQPVAHTTHNNDSATDTKVAEMTADEIAKQESILRDIREAQEREQLEWALKESSYSSSTTNNLRSQFTKEPTQSSDDWQANQRAAFEEFERKQRETLAEQRQLQQQLEQKQQNHMHMHRHATTGSVRSADSALSRGQQETEDAIRAGQAHIVRCQGCSSRLRAPVQYSLVYCPRCGHVSPAE